MLGVLTKGLGLPDPIVRVASPTWVFAETINLGDGASLLAIYRSTWLRDTDTGYEDVRALLDRSESDEIYRRSIEDEAMMHARGEWIIYVLNPVKNPAPIARQVIGIVKEWGEPFIPLHVPAEIAKRLRAVERSR